MRSKMMFQLLLLAALVSITTLNSCKHEVVQDDVAELLIPGENLIPGQYLILFKEGFIQTNLPSADQLTRQERPARAEANKEIVRAKILELVQPMGIAQDAIIDVYAELFQGFAAKLTQAQLDALLVHPAVKMIEQDMVVSLPDYVLEFETPGLRAQTTPCGITNAGGSVDGSASSKWIWILDTGIDLDHPDLNVETDPAYAKSFAGSSNPDDCNGHGTHCAGIAAAKNNDIGVVGVSAGARVVPVRVLGCGGSGSTSSIISGMNHIAANDEAGDVMNASLGGYWGANCATASSYVTALTNLSNAGTRCAIAAGNSSANAANYTPACINGTNIHTIASMTCAKAWSSFSNFGRPPIDWIATGSSVYSTYKNGGYSTLSGTSMASPHVAGIMHSIQAAPNQTGSVTFSGVTYPIATR